jgi:predicted transcriptional regulator with HTH domain
MNEPVSVPSVEKAQTNSTPKTSAVDEGQILDEGLDLSGYIGTHGKPFVADYFGIGDLYNTNPEIAEMVDGVTENIMSQTEGMNLVYVAKSILDELGQEVNLKENDAGLYKLKQTIKIMGMKQQAKQLDLMKKKVLDDIDKM